MTPAIKASTPGQLIRVTADLFRLTRYGDPRGFSKSASNLSFSRC